MGWFNRIMRANRTPEEVIEVLNAILERRISDEEWDDFISVKIIDPKLDEVRGQVEEIWTEDSPYRVPGSIDPTALNPKGVAEIQKLIVSIKEPQA